MTLTLCSCIGCWSLVCVSACGCLLLLPDAYLENSWKRHCRSWRQVGALSATDFSNNESYAAAVILSVPPCSLSTCFFVIIATVPVTCYCYICESKHSHMIGCLKDMQYQPCISLMLRRRYVCRKEKSKIQSP